MPVVVVKYKEDTPGIERVLEILSGNICGIVGEVLDVPAEIVAYDFVKRNPLSNREFSIEVWGQNTPERLADKDERSDRIKSSVKNLIGEELLFKVSLWLCEVGTSS